MFPSCRDESRRLQGSRALRLSAATSALSDIETVDARRPSKIDIDREAACFF